MRGGQSVNRGQSGIDAMYPAEKARAKRKKAGAETPATADPLAGEGGTKPGGGGAGCTKPRRADPFRVRQVKEAPGQAEALALANAQFFSPSRKMRACRHQRSTGGYYETLPLSPVAARGPCVTPECRCRMSHRQLALSVPLYSPSQSKHAHHLAGEAGQASRARITFQREADKKAHAASKVEWEAAKGAEALLFEPRGDHSTPRPPTYSTGGQCGASPDPTASLLLAFASEGQVDSTVQRP